LLCVFTDYSCSQYIKEMQQVRDTIKGIRSILTTREGWRGFLKVSLYRNAIYLALNSAVNALGGFLFWIIAAKLYTTESIGLASAAISAIGLLSSITNLGLNYGLIRFLSSSGEKAHEMVNSCITLSGILSGVTALVFLTGLTFWSPALLPLREHWVFVIAFITFTIAQNFYGILQATFISMRRTGFNLAHSLIENLLVFIPIAPLAIFATLGIFASWGMGLSVAGVVAIFVFLPRVLTGYRLLFIIKRSSVNPIIKYSLVNFISNQLQNAPSSIIPLMVVNMLGAEQNAYFYIGWIMGTAILTIPAAMANSLFAEGSNKGQDLDNLVKRSFKFLLILIIPSVIVILLLADKLLLIFGAGYSQNSIVLLRLLIVSSIPGSINLIYFAVKRVQMKLNIVVILNGFIAATTLGLSYFLLPSMGITGVGIAWLGSQGIVALGILISLFQRRPAVRKTIP
jgi:O-antigen/teichoic acid export membrane protein